MPICGIVCRTDYLHDLVGGDQIAIGSITERVVPNRDAGHSHRSQTRLYKRIRDYWRAWHQERDAANRSGLAGSCEFRKFQLGRLATTVRSANEESDGRNA
jgi:hypothetical protein